jgi:hypothetical protein
MIYAPVRQHPDGEEWVQWLNSDSTEAGCRHNTSRDEKWCPDFCEKYPLVRIAKFDCTEIKED